MRIHRVVAAMCVFVVAMALAGPAAAQPGTAVVAAGISFLHEGGSVGQTAKGVAIDVAYNFLSSGQVDIGAVGDIGFNKFDGCTEKAFGGGGRATFKAGAKAMPFGQFVVGRANCGSGSGVTMLQPGFGVDIAISRMLNFRGQVDLRSLRFSSSSSNEQRFWFGISANLGR